jgi:hypothetical protein
MPHTIRIKGVRKSVLTLYKGIVSRHKIKIVIGEQVGTLVEG